MMVQLCLVSLPHSPNESRQFEYIFLSYYLLQKVHDLSETMVALLEEEMADPEVPLDLFKN